MGRPGRKLEDPLIAEIRKDLAAGMKLDPIAKKHGVSWPVVKRISMERGGKAASNGRAKTNGSAAVQQATNGAVVTIGAELLDRIWLSLAPEKKAALLSTL